MMSTGQLPSPEFPIPIAIIGGHVLVTICINKEDGIGVKGQPMQFNTNAHPRRVGLESATAEWRRIPTVLLPQEIMTNRSDVQVKCLG